MLVENGQPVDPNTWDPLGGALQLTPRTSVGLSQDGSKLIFIVIDGRKQGFSAGVTLPEMAGYLIEFGAYTGLNFDGGGSSTMVFGTPNGPEIINYPSEATERVRPNHLGIYAAPATPAAVSEPVVLSQVCPAKKDTLTSSLWQNYPNPFNPETWIPYALSVDAHVVIRVYDLRGQLTRMLDLGHKPTGIYISKARAAYWDGRNESGEHVASGVYFYSIKAGDLITTRKMIVTR